ncbi:hypothetical protein ML5_5951 [Micromonospora sp. L5]|nr:hypothetical protein ML5_5951 [Micromonospora sp. L5]
MDTSRHIPGCATAQGHLCRCTECGGSQHGVQGWLDHVDRDNASRRRRRKNFESKLTWTLHQPRSLQKTRVNREITTDLARVDVADWLATPSPPRTGTEDGEPYPSPAEQVSALAEAMTRGAWREIATELDRADPDATDVKRDLTHHGWCDLFIALAKVIEETRHGLDSIPGKAKDMILRSLLQADRPTVTEAVVSLIVDKVWHGFQAAAFSVVTMFVRRTGPSTEIGAVEVHAAPISISTHGDWPLDLGVIRRRCQRACKPLAAAAFNRLPACSASCVTSPHCGQDGRICTTPSLVATSS